MSNSIPTVGRIVHYVSYGTPGGEFAPEHRAAIVTEATEVDPFAVASMQARIVGLCVINPTGVFFNRGVQYDPNCAGGTWHWPELE